MDICFELKLIDVIYSIGTMLFSKHSTNEYQSEAESRNPGCDVITQLLSILRADASLLNCELYALLRPRRSPTFSGKEKNSSSRVAERTGSSLAVL